MVGPQNRFGHDVEDAPVKNRTSAGQPVGSHLTDGGILPSHKYTHTHREREIALFY